MSRKKTAKKAKVSFGTILYWTVGSLLILTMLSTWLVTGLFAKYVISDTVSDSARVAGTGTVNLELWEHNADLDNGIYKLTDQEVKKNTYNKVIPGVDIVKDPFIRLEINNAEVSYMLYLKVTESNPFPDTVSYSLRKNWLETSPGSGVYLYVDELTKDPIIFEPKKHYVFNDENPIKILVNDMVYVSEHYEGKGQNFSLTFDAWLKQVKTD